MFNNYDLISVSIETIQQIEARYKAQNIFRNKKQEQSLEMLDYQIATKEFDSSQVKQIELKEEEDDSDSILW